MNYSEKQNSIIEDFSMFEDWMEKYEFIIELGKEVNLIPEQEKSDDLLIEGCQSRVWLKSEFNNGQMYFFNECLSHTVMNASMNPWHFIVVNVKLTEESVIDTLKHIIG